MLQVLSCQCRVLCPTHRHEIAQCYNNTPCCTKASSSSTSSSSRNEYYLGGIIALLLQDHRTMSTKSVCSSKYMVTDQHWATGAQIEHSTLWHSVWHSNIPYTSRSYNTTVKPECWYLPCVTCWPSACIINMGHSILLNCTWSHLNKS